MFYGQVRYFDGETGRTGLPPDVAALVSRIEKDWIEIEVINLNVFESRQLIIQGGAYGEHKLLAVDYHPLANPQPSARRRPPRDPAAPLVSRELNSTAFTAKLAPGSGSKLKIRVERNVGQPTYHFPWNH